MRMRVAATPRTQVRTTLAASTQPAAPHNPGGEPRHQQRGDSAPRRPARQQRRHHHQREDAAHHHAVPDQAAELLQAREVDEHQAVEGRGRRPHAEQHAARRSRDRRRHVGVGVLGPRQRCTRRRAARHRRRRGRTSSPPRRWRRPTGWRRCNPIAPSTTTSDRSDGSDPTVTSHALRNTMNSSGRISASDPTVFSTLSRLITASVSTAIRCPPANSTRSGGRGSSSAASGGTAAAAAMVRPISRSLASSARENCGVVGRTLRPRDHQPAVAVVGHVAVGADAHAEARLRAAQRLAQQVEQPGRILAHESRHVGRRHREQLAAGGDGVPDPLRREAMERVVEDAIAQHQQLVVGEPVRDRGVRSTTPASTRAISGALRRRSTHAAISSLYSPIAWPSGAVNTT